ncbi:MAG: alpha/beta fold hydrolase [Alphaproteobacteria bacterium]
MKLNFTESGDGAPIVIVHGLFGSGRNWGTLGKALAKTWRVITVDMRNHGASPWDARMDYPAMADDLLELIADEGLDRPVLLGHSMGGKAAMAAALTEPGAIGALIVADIAPVAYGHSHEPHIKAMCALDLSVIARRGDADAALSAAVPEPGLRGFLLHNLSFGDDGPSWNINLDVLDAAMPDLVAFPYEAGQTRYDGETLFIRGGASPYVPPGHEAAITGFFPQAAIETIEGAGHWIHAERPAEFLVAVERFLAGVD